jgi:sulfonate transport system substrate-binding protein
MNKKTIVLSTIIGIILVVIAFNLLYSPEVEEVQIGTFFSAIDYAPYYIAKHNGWFEEVAGKHETSISYTEFQTLPTINEALATGKLDVIFEAEPPAIIGKAAGVDVEIKGMGVSLTQEILVHKDSSIKNIEDLKGKKIAVLSGTSSHYGVLKILEENGISGSDVEIIDMTPPDANAAFESKLIDAWAVWPPWVEQHTVTGNSVTLEKGDAFIQSIVAVRGKFSDENPELTQDLLNTVTRAKEWINNNEEEAQEIVATELDLPLEVVIEAWPKHDFQATIGEVEKADIQAKADFLFDTGSIKKKINVEELVVL